VSIELEIHENENMSAISVRTDWNTLQVFVGTGCNCSTTSTYRKRLC